VSELKSLSGTNQLPAGMLASGAEGIKEAIQGFDDAYVVSRFIGMVSTDKTGERAISRTNACHQISLM
jgi:hypothetical protein